MTADRLIGIDVGTTSVKAVLTDGAGHALDRFAEPYPAARPAPGRVEQDPADWLRLVRAALARFAAHGPVRAIGLTSQVNTHVFADAALAPLGPAPTWQDTRAAAAAAALDAGVTEAERLARFGAPMPIDASNAVARMAWRAGAEPEAWAATAHVLSPKDWVAARLTGAVAADPIASVGLVGPDLAYVAGLMDRVPGAARRLPPLVDPLTLVGTVRPGEPLAGTPVCLGTMDAWAGVFGLGAAADGAAFYLSGTSEVLGAFGAAGAPTPGVVVFPPWRGLRLHAAPTQAGGAALDWAARLIGRAPAETAALAGAAIGPTSPIFLPHLEGERAPLWDAAARGAFAGLSGATGPEALAAAVLEGVAFAARLAFEAAARSAGAPDGPLRAGGGGMRADAWAQLRADVLGRPLDRVAGADAGARGAAILAGVACGGFADLAEAAGALVAVERRFEPDPARRATLDARFETFGLLYDRLRPVNARLSGAAAPA